MDFLEAVVEFMCDVARSIAGLIGYVLALLLFFYCFSAFVLLVTWVVQKVLP